MTRSASIDALRDAGRVRRGRLLGCRERRSDLRADLVLEPLLVGGAELARRSELAVQAGERIACAPFLEFRFGAVADMVVEVRAAVLAPAVGVGKDEARAAARARALHRARSGAPHRLGVVAVHA